MALVEVNLNNKYGLTYEPEQVQEAFTLAAARLDAGTPEIVARNENCWYASIETPHEDWDEVFNCLDSWSVQWNGFWDLKQV